MHIINHPGRMSDMLGCNIRPGMVPGGFAPGFFVSETTLGKRRGRPRRKHEEIVEAAMVVLENWQMPRAEEKALADASRGTDAQPA